MLVIVAYDVNTETPAGKKRLRRVAEICQSFGQRAQKSVFECTIGERELVRLRALLLSTVDPAKDSLRLYFINSADQAKIESYGRSGLWDLEGPLIV